MAAPISLYVDEISPGKIKATVSTRSTIAYNLKMISLVSNPFFANAFRGPMISNLREEANRITITPIGKFICMLVKKDMGNGMIFLDLIDKSNLAAAMAEKLGQVDLREKFMQVYDEIISHPERHNRYELIIRQAEAL